MNTPTRLLTIAGSDSGGGAGIQADLKTFTALGGFGMSVITAITAQNTREVRAVVPMPVSMVTQQFLAVAEDIGMDAAKTGMLHDGDIIAQVAHLWRDHGHNLPLVVDPVMVTSTGHPLLDEGAVHTLKQALIPQATLLTPNLDEAVILAGRPRHSVRSRADLQSLAQDLLALGCQAVLVKGGHLLEGDVVFDVYADQRKTMHTWRHRRIHTRNSHGTGCTLSAAITSFLGRKIPMLDAIAQARRYLLGALRASSAQQLGDLQLGHGPLFHAYRVR